MIFDDLKKVYQSQVGQFSNAYLLNLLKEKLQDYILHFVYTHEEFSDLVFTGGTCLRKIYGLNRLSVDLDFDTKNENFSHDFFAKRLEEWFEKSYQAKTVSAVRRKETVKVKVAGALEAFPGIGKEVVFVSVDISPLRFQHYGTEKNMVSTPEFSFFTNNFDLPTMFANKICAFLKREFYFGDEQKISFKARDVYDLFWLFQRSKQGGYRLKPNFERLFEELKTRNRDLIQKQIMDKVEQLNDDQVLHQLLPFFPDRQFVVDFVKIYRLVLREECPSIIS